MGLVAGGTGAFCGTPADVTLVRMTVDCRLPEAERRNYKSVFDAWRRIVAEEGVAALWTGCLPTIGRAMVVNVCQLATQTQAKQEIEKAFQGSTNESEAFKHEFSFSEKLLHVVLFGFNGIWLRHDMLFIAGRYCQDEDTEYEGLINSHN